MTDLQKEFIKLAKEKESATKHLKVLDIRLTDHMKQMPVGEMFQDSEDGVVYQIIFPSGTYMLYKSIDYLRTRKDGETNGTLSMKAAKEAGFILKEEEKK
jgi:hypothetical protein